MRGPVGEWSFQSRARKPPACGDMLGSSLARANGMNSRRVNGRRSNSRRVCGRRVHGRRVHSRHLSACCWCDSNLIDDCGAHAMLGEVVGDAAACHPTANDHGLGSRCGHRRRAGAHDGCRQAQQSSAHFCLFHSPVLIPAIGFLNKISTNKPADCELIPHPYLYVTVTHRT